MALILHALESGAWFIAALLSEGRRTPCFTPMRDELIAPSAVCRCADKSGLLWFAGGKRGDGLLAEFGSVVDAVECAVTLQRGMVERNASVPDGKRIELRIGI